MYLSQIPNKRSGRTFLQISESYRDKTGKPRQRAVLPIGYLDELKQTYADPIAFFTEKAKEMTKEKQLQQSVVPLPIPVYSRLQPAEAGEDANRKNIGYAAISSIYHELEIDYFLNNRRRYTKAAYNHNAIFKLLVADRILFPASKRGAWFHKDRLFERMDFSLEDIYRSLQFFVKHRDQLLMAIHKRITHRYQRDTTLVYYDVTNYYFEIDKEDMLRRKGVSKEHRPDPIVQMGLFMDEQGLPISYGLYPGNSNDCTTLPSMMGDLTYEYGIDHAIIVADKGMMTGNNVARIRAERNGYVISYSVRGASKTFQQYVLDEEGYTYWGADAKYKSRIYARTIEFTNHAGRQEKITINERQIVFYSSKYAEKAKRDRAKAVEKARAMAANPALRAKAKMKGAAKYLHTIQYDKEGEVISGLQDDVVFDEQKLAEEELLDGYYVIMTNVIGIDEHTKPFRGKSRYLADGFFQLNRPVSDTDIIEMYKGLWKIEESFKVTKSDLRTRPVYLSREDHIEAHFLVCFVALTILRLLEYRLDNQYSARRIAESLRRAAGTQLEDGYYVFDYYDEVLAALGNELNLDFSRKYLKQGEIRSMIGKTKKTS